MRAEDAPVAGWFPDPENRTRLRWWDGGDWSDITRAPPSQVEVTAHAATLAAEASAAELAATSGYTPVYPSQLVPPPGYTAADVTAMTQAASSAARSEIDLAVAEARRSTQQAVAHYTPLITEYTNKFIRLLKWLIALVIVGFVIWFAYEVFATATFWDWVGERIDNITNDSG